MDRAGMIAFMKANPNCCVASVEGDKPHTRILTMYRVDDSGIILQSDKRKDLYKQLLKNPQVEICFFDTTKYVEVRVSGRMEIVEDLALKQELVEARAFLKPVVDEIGHDTIAVYRLRNGKATAWSFTTDVEPKTWIDI
jgi:pyridoxamine 5'-phosphate oxidase